ncbi:SigE family RNA polymerase sigma factor [Streptomyces noursei]
MTRASQEEESAGLRPGAGHTEFETYVHEQRGALVRMAHCLVRDPSEAQDLVQVALTKAYLHWDRIADKGRADSYVHRIMRNTYTDWWRARRIEEISQETLPDGLAEDFTQRYVESAYLHQVLATLPPRRRSIVALRYLESCSTQETAQVLDVATGTVKSGLRWGLVELRNKMGAASH